MPQSPQKQIETKPTALHVATQVLSPSQYTELEKFYQSLNPTDLTREILHVQNTLTSIAAGKLKTSSLSSFKHNNAEKKSTEAA